MHQTVLPKGCRTALRATGFGRASACSRLTPLNYLPCQNRAMSRRPLAMVLVLAATVAVSGQTGTSPLVAVQRIPLPAVNGRIDHLAVDLERAHLSWPPS